MSVNGGDLVWRLELKLRGREEKTHGHRHRRRRAHAQHSMCSWSALVSCSLRTCSSEATAPLSAASLARLRPATAAASSPSALLSPDSCLHLLSLANSRFQPQPQGLCLHVPVVKLGLDGHLLLANNLLSLYTKCCPVTHARKLFDEMPVRDVVSWTAIISAYANAGNHEEALRLFEELRLETRLIPNEFTFSVVLRCAASLEDLHSGARSHAHIIKCGFASSPVLGSAVVHLYSKCLKLEDAAQAFAAIGDRDAISWTTMISAHVQAENWRGAFQLYVSMLETGASPNEFTFTKTLQASSSLGPYYGMLVHSHTIVCGADLNLVLKTALVDMYSKCRRMGEAVKVFNQTPESDVMLWTAMLSGYSRAEDYDAALAAFQEMESAGVPPNSFTYAGVLSTCSAIPDPELGKQLHSRVVKVGLDHDISIGNALIDLYAKCSSNVVDVLRAFEVIAFPNVISWTALISGLARHSRNEEALEAFLEMRVAGVQPNSFTLSTILSCGSLRTVAHAQKLHAYVLKTMSEYSDVTIGNSLVDLYARFKRACDAWNASQEMPCRDVFTYTSLAKGLNHMGLHRRALAMITYMHEDGVKMDGFCLASFLSASAGLTAVEFGKQLHCHSAKSGLCCWISVSNGLIDMYGKCGSVAEARKVFMAIPEPNVVSWNGLISGLASNGCFSQALSVFEDLRLARAQPDGVTFLLVLYACSHGGLVDLGLEYFDSMRETFGVAPAIDHYVCLVDMLGRAGRLEAAASAIDSMPFRPDALIYKTLLSSCKLHGNLALGESTARCLLEIEPSDPAVYVLLASMYDDAGRPDLGEQTRRMMADRGGQKCPGQSWMMVRSRS